MKVYRPISRIVLSATKPISTMQIVKLAWSEQLLCTASEVNQTLAKMKAMGKIS